MTIKPAFRGDARLFFLEGGGDPEVDVTYEGFAKVGRPAYNFGDITNHYAPDPLHRRRYTIIGKTSGAETPPQLPVSAIYSQSLSKWLRLGKQKCDHDLQVHLGNCGAPQDYNGGYEKILVLEKARINSWGLDGDLGSFAPNDEGTVNEEVPFIGEILYEVKKFDAFAQIGASVITRPIVDGVIADSVSCGGDCGVISDGCSIVLFVSSATVGSPGLPPTLYYTDDGGSTVSSMLVNSAGATENPGSIGFDGTYIFVPSPDSESVHYAVLADILDASATFTEVTTGFVAAHGPIANYVAGPRDIFMSGKGGYVYHSNNIASGTDVVESGSLTAQDLNDIHGVDDQHVVAVGNSNAVIYTTDGHTFALVTGPAPGVVLNRVYMVTPFKWFVAAADGNLYYTKNAGGSWAAAGFAGSGTGNVHAIWFATNDVGFMSHTTAGNVGRLFKTIDGGSSWAILPEISGGPTVTSHRTTVRIMPCDQNTIYAVGTNNAGTGGMVIKGV